MGVLTRGIGEGDAIGPLLLTIASTYSGPMADMPGLRSLRIDSVRVPSYSFNHLVLQFEDGKQVRVPVTEATADEIKGALQSQESLKCKSSSELSPACPGCPLCDPARET